MRIVYDRAMAGMRRRVLATQLALLGGLAGPAAAQHEHAAESRPMIRAGAHAIGLLTHANPGLRGENLTEGYLTQPIGTLHARAGAARFDGMLNLEGVTLERGELNAGVWGEGYMDRRHPHTYLHEAVITLQQGVAAGIDVSLAAGRGFAPFGSDDPMARPLVKYPSNHHLAQILERYVLIAGIRRGPVVLEGGLFNGDEPLSPSDLGDFDRFGDSWSIRTTLVPTAGVELSASRTFIESPEQPFGGGLDHKAWHVAARVQRQTGRLEVYGLAEAGRTGEFSGDVEIFHLHTVLAEVAARGGGWQVAARFERSDRPEEERLVDLFRSVRPATDNSVLGTTRWTTATVQIARTQEWRGISVQPLIEASRLWARPNERPAILDPVNLYGSPNLWGLSVGIRTTVGLRHTRMGRYGVAQANPVH